MSTTDFLFHCRACPAFLQVANHMVEDWAAAIALARLERWELRRGGWVCPVCADMGEECSCGGINTCEIIGKGRVKCRACGLEMSVTGSVMPATRAGRGGGIGMRIFRGGCEQNTTIPYCSHGRTGGLWAVEFVGRPLGDSDMLDEYPDPGMIQDHADYTVLILRLGVAIGRNDAEGAVDLLGDVYKDIGDHFWKHAMEAVAERHPELFKGDEDGEEEKG